MRRCCTSSSIVGAPLTLSARLKSGGFSIGRTGKNQPDITREVSLKYGNENVPRVRAPGQTKIVTMTNKSGRQFKISIPTSMITHPQKKLVSPLGKWKELDTSYVDTGDFDEDIPSPIDEMRASSTLTAASACEELTTMARTFSCTDRNGMVSTPYITERHAGPEYEFNERKLTLRRSWFTLKHRYDDVVSVAFPQARLNKAAVLPEAETMYEALKWLKAANSMHVSTRMPYEDGPQSNYEPMNLTPALAATCKRIAADSGRFFSGPSGAARIVTIAALCRECKVPFAACFSAQTRASRRTRKDRGGASDVVHILNAVQPLVAESRSSRDSEGRLQQTTALAVLQALYSAPSLSLSELGDVSTTRSCLEVIDGLLSLCTRQAADDSLAYFSGQEMVTLLRFLQKFRADNASICSHANSTKAYAGPFRESLRLHIAAVIARCSKLLYQCGKTTVVSEDGLIPFLELQKHADTQHPDIHIHHRIGREHAEGLRQVFLSASDATHMATLIGQLTESAEIGNVAPSLCSDLLHHTSAALSGLVPSGDVKVEALVEMLENIASLMQTNADFDSDDVWRVNKIISSIDQKLGLVLQEVREVALVARLWSAFGQCRCEPSCRSRLEAVTLKTLSSAVPSSALLPLLEDALHGMAMLPSGVSPTVVDSVVRAAMPAVKAARPKKASAALWVRFLWSLYRLDYADIAGVVLAVLPCLEVQAVSMLDATTHAKRTTLLCVARDAYADRGDSRRVSRRLDKMVRSGLRNLVAALRKSATVPLPLAAHVMELVPLMSDTQKSELRVGLASVGVAEDAVRNASLEVLVRLVVNGMDIVPTDAHRGCTIELTSRLRKVRASLVARYEPTPRHKSLKVDALDHKVALGEESDPSYWLRSSWEVLRWGATVGTMECPHIAALLSETARVLACCMRVALDDRPAASSAQQGGFEIRHQKRQNADDALAAMIGQCNQLLEQCNLADVAESQLAELEA